MSCKRSFCAYLVASAFVSSVGLFAACESPPSKQSIGTAAGAIVGGAVGALVGSGTGKAAAIAGGAVVGGLIGNVIGKHMDDNDRKKMDAALSGNPPGKPTSWTNSTTGNSFTVTPNRTYVNNDGQQCRDFVQDAVIDGKPQKVSGTACKRPNGSSWDQIS